MRGGAAGMLFRGVLEEALRRFNPRMMENAIRSVAENLLALPPTIEGNRQVLAWLRGERQWYDEAEERHRQVRLIDFENPSANVLYVTWGVAAQAAGRKGNCADISVPIAPFPIFLAMGNGYTKVSLTRAYRPILPLPACAGLLSSRHVNF